MDLAQFVIHVEQSIEGVELGEVKPGTNFRALKTWDSLALLTLIDTVDMEYGVLLKKVEVDGCDTVEALYQVVATKQ